MLCAWLVELYTMDQKRLYLVLFCHRTLLLLFLIHVCSPETHAPAGIVNLVYTEVTLQANSFSNSHLGVVKRLSDQLYSSMSFKVVSSSPRAASVAYSKSCYSGRVRVDCIYVEVRFPPQIFVSPCLGPQNAR